MNSFILFYSEFFIRIKYDVQENLDKIEFKIDKEKVIISSPINWIDINYANDKKHDQKLRDDAKLEIDIINKDIKSALIDDTIQMRDQCVSLHS